MINHNLLVGGRQFEPLGYKQRLRELMNQSSDISKPAFGWLLMLAEFQTCFSLVANRDNKDIYFSSVACWSIINKS